MFKRARGFELKIAIVVERFPPDTGGSGVRFCKLAERLSRKHTLDVFTVGPIRALNLGRGFNVHRFDLEKLPIPRLWGLNSVVSLTSSTFFQLSFRSYDIIDIDIWPFLPFFSAKMAKPNTPAILSWNVVWPFSFQKATSGISTLFARACSKLSTHNITVSNFAKTMLLKHLQMNPSTVSMIPNGIDEAFFKAKLRPKWGQIVFVGRLEPQKRLDLILAAFKIFRKNVNDAELHIVGEGSLKSQLVLASKKVDGLYLHGSIPAGSTQELISTLDKSWIFVSASEFETYGMSISEALGMGLPVVLTNAPNNAAVHETAKHGFNSLIVEHNQPMAIANAFERLYKDRELWDRLSSNAKSFPVSYSWDDVAKRVEAVYEEVSRR